MTRSCSLRDATLAALFVVGPLSTGCSIPECASLEDCGEGSYCSPDYQCESAPERRPPFDNAVVYAYQGVDLAGVNLTGAITGVPTFAGGAEEVWLDTYEEDMNLLVYTTGYLADVSLSLPLALEELPRERREWEAWRAGVSNLVANGECPYEADTLHTSWQEVAGGRDYLFEVTTARGDDVEVTLRTLEDAAGEDESARGGASTPRPRTLSELD